MHLINELLNDRRSTTSPRSSGGISSLRSEDELRLAKLGYAQETKRIFNWYTNFGLTSSMISVLLGIIPLYSFSLKTGGPVVMIWSWIIIGSGSMLLVSALSEISSAYPSMGAVYYWAFRLGGSRWGPVASWMSGWCNLLGQVAGLASGGYAGAEIIANIIQLQTGYSLNRDELFLLYLLVLMAAGVVNMFTETLLTTLCRFSVVWHVVGTTLIVVWMISAAPELKPIDFVFTDYNNDSGFSTVSYVGFVGMLAAASTFTGYDTGAHVAEETIDAHIATPVGMIGAAINCIFFGVLLIVGMNVCIQDIHSLTSDLSSSNQAYTQLWRQTVGKGPATAFLIIVFVAIQCSNCANLTSASRMAYSFARDGALPYSTYLYALDQQLLCPLRAIWFCVFSAFVLGLPGLADSEVLGALFSLTATGLYVSYFIPLLLYALRGREVFVPAEFNLGPYSEPIHWFSLLWCIIMTICLCLPQRSPIAAGTYNYAPLVLFFTLAVVGAWWFFSARYWFQGANMTPIVFDAATGEIISSKVYAPPSSRVFDVNADNMRPSEDTAAAGITEGGDVGQSKQSGARRQAEQSNPLCHNYEGKQRLDGALGVYGEDGAHMRNYNDERVDNKNGTDSTLDHPPAGRVYSNTGRICSLDTSEWTQSTCSTGDTMGAMKFSKDRRMSNIDERFIPPPVRPSIASQYAEDMEEGSGIL